MMDIIGQAGISEVVLLFNLLFVLPTLALLLRRLRKYEAQFGDLPDAGKKPKAPHPPPAKEQKKPSDGKYPYKPAVFLSPSERSCLSALAVALGPEVAVYPKVALWEWIEPTEKDPEYRERLHGLELDFLVCDSRTGQALTGIMFKDMTGRPGGMLAETNKICAAAGVKLTSMKFVEGGEYDAEKLKKELGIPDMKL